MSPFWNKSTWWWVKCMKSYWQHASLNKSCKPSAFWHYCIYYGICWQWHDVKPGKPATVSHSVPLNNSYLLQMSLLRSTTWQFNYVSRLWQHFIITPWPKWSFLEYSCSISWSSFFCQVSCVYLSGQGRESPEKQKQAPAKSCWNRKRQRPNTTATAKIIPVTHSCLQAMLPFSSLFQHAV